MTLVHGEIDLLTAITNVGLALVAFIGALYLLVFVRRKQWKRSIWLIFFTIMFIASLVAAIYHGFEIPPYFRVCLWYGVLVLLGLLISSFVLAVSVDLVNEDFSKRAILPVLFIFLIVFVFSFSLKDKIFAFAVYQFLISAVAFIGYSILALRRQSSPRGSWFMALGSIVSIVAMAVQLDGSLSVSIIWDLDHNIIYHFVQAFGVVLFILGLRRFYSEK
ncbi:DUF6962 family protein [Microbulbifer sp. ZKSA002]|uniref:DUF6962 family protein n=1 Tax=Microbulbifer sp. ZKSA002 TaxID=3243388 RepID=UPI00403A731C